MGTSYERRIIDATLDELQPQLAAIVLQGPKGVGKTATALQRAESTLALDMEIDRQRFEAAPELIKMLPAPLLIDEWQRAPMCWDHVRRAVDDGAAPGRFILTGSATTPRGVILHSGAGRIVGLRMRPLSLFERAIEAPTVSLAALLQGRAEVGGTTSVRLADYVEEITASGFPGIRKNSPRVRRTLLDAYLDTIVQKEFPEQGYPVRRPDALRAWLAAYAAATSTTASYSTILDAATPGESNKPTRVTATVYRDVLSQLWLLDDLEAWLPTKNRLARLTQVPKHQLADPALSARLLGVDAEALMRGEQGHFAGDPKLREGTLLGALFEHLASMSMQVYAAAAEATVRHLRTKAGEHEIDLIVQRQDGRVLAVEIKLSATVTDEHVAHLHWLRREIGDDLIDAVVLTTGEHAYRRKDGVAVIPLALLGP